jgi:Flp pilus assembly protein TadD
MFLKDSDNKAGGTAKLKTREKDREKKHTAEGNKRKAGYRWFWFFMAALALAAVSYANSLQNQYVFDDLNLIAASSQITGIDNIPSLLLSGKMSAYYRPLRTISYTLDYTLNKAFWYRFANRQWTDRGLVPFGYHVSNIFYHIVTALLVYLVILKLSLNSRAAFIGAGLFVLHPVHTDSVTYLSGRRDILFTLFYLAGFYLFLAYRQARQKRFIVAAFLMYLLSMGSKEMGVTLPALFLAYDLIKNFNPHESGLHAGYGKAFLASLTKSLKQGRFLYPITFLGALAFSYYKVFIKSPSLQSSYYGDSALATFLTVTRILVHYLKLLLYPIRLVADYSYNAFPLSVSLKDPAAVTAVVLLLLLGYMTLRLLTNHKMMAFGMAWFFITLLPVCHIFPHHELLAEHYLYLPSVGLCLVAALAGERALTNGRYTLLLTVCFLMVGALFSVRIWDRNRDWSDSLTLYEKTVTTVPQGARAHSNLGEAYASRGRIDEAIAACKRALAIKPGHAEAHYNLGFAYYKKGLFDEAIAEYREALSAEPRYPKALNNLGAAYLEKGEIHEAIFYFMKALQFKSVQTEVLIGLSVAFSKIGMTDKAIDRAGRALALKPSLAVAHNNLAYFYYLKRDYGLAIEHCDKAVEGGYPVPDQLIKWLEPYRINNQG